MNEGRRESMKRLIKKALAKIEVGEVRGKKKIELGKHITRLYECEICNGGCSME